MHVFIRYNRTTSLLIVYRFALIDGRKRDIAREFVVIFLLHFPFSDNTTARAKLKNETYRQSP